MISPEEDEQPLKVQWALKYEGAGEYDADAPV